MKTCKNAFQMVSGHLRQYGQQWARIFAEDCFDREKQCYCYFKLLLQNKHDTANTLYSNIGGNIELRQISGKHFFIIIILQM